MVSANDLAESFKRHKTAVTSSISCAKHAESEQRTAISLVLFLSYCLPPTSQLFIHTQAKLIGTPNKKLKARWKLNGYVLRLAVSTGIDTKRQELPDVHQFANPICKSCCQSMAGSHQYHRHLARQIETSKPKTDRKHVVVTTACRKKTHETHVSKTFLCGTLRFSAGIATSWALHGLTKPQNMSPNMGWTWQLWPSALDFALVFGAASCESATSSGEAFSGVSFFFEVDFSGVSFFFVAGFFCALEPFVVPFGLCLTFGDLLDLESFAVLSGSPKGRSSTSTASAVGCFDPPFAVPFFLAFAFPLAFTSGFTVFSTGFSPSDSDRASTAAKRGMGKGLKEKRPYDVRQQLPAKPNAARTMTTLPRGFTQKAGAFTVNCDFNMFLGQESNSLFPPMFFDGTASCQIQSCGPSGPHRDPSSTLDCIISRWMTWDLWILKLRINIEMVIAMRKWKPFQAPSCSQDHVERRQSKQEVSNLIKNMPSF